MYVFLDSNSVLRDRHFDSTDIDVLVASAEEANITLCVPEIVIEEVIEKHRVQLTQHERNIHSAANEYERISRNKVSIQGPEIEVDVKNFENELKKNIRNLGGKVVGLSNPSHDELSTWAIQRRSPFSDSGGYRDALIWKTLLSHGERKGGYHVFITGDIKDFLTGDGCLQKGLAKDLEASNLPRENFAVYDSLDSFVADELKPLLDRADQISRASRSSIGDMEGFDEKLEDALWLKSVDVRGPPRLGTLCDAEVVGVMDYAITENQGVRILSGGRILVDLWVEAECKIRASETIRHPEGRNEWVDHELDGKIGFAVSVVCGRENERIEKIDVHHSETRRTTVSKWVVDVH